LAFAHSRILGGQLQGPHVLCLGTLAPIGDVELDLLAFIEGLVPVAADVREVDEDVLVAIGRGDEAVALFSVEELSLFRLP
jgi:hypothetical protein